jgi:hypothetical protein
VEEEDDRRPDSVEEVGGRGLYIRQRENQPGERRWRRRRRYTMAVKTGG